MQTPNYGLGPDDIPRVSQPEGPERTDHFTLQHLGEPPRYNPAAAATLADIVGSLDPFVAFGYGLNVDALFRGTSSLPHAVILDYVYGVAAYKCWSSRRGDNDVHDVMGNYRSEHYINIPAISPGPPIHGGEDLPFNDPYDPDFDPNAPADSHDPDHPPTTLSQRRHYTSTRTGDVMAKAMDELNIALMFVSGITPQEAADRREKQMEEEELKAQEASRSKVTEWMKTTDVSSS